MPGDLRGRADFWEGGTWNAVCFQCGRKRKASEMKRHWQGYYVCPEHWEARHPQDFVRSIPDRMGVPWAQPPEDAFTAFCSLSGRSAIADQAVADCAIANLVLPTEDV
jgi:hypothetical protein